MSDIPDLPPVIDFDEARHRLRHELDEQRLLRVQQAFARALPLPGPKPRKNKGSGKGKGKGKKR